MARTHKTGDHTEVPQGRRGHRNGPLPTSHQPSINVLKTKIRNVTRVLEHSQRLPPGARVEKERALAGYKQDLESALKAKRRQHMIQKYHMVRFFERQKATRNLKKLKARLQKSEAGSDMAENLRRACFDSEIDLNYTMFYPLDEKYVSLFTKSTTPSHEGDHGDEASAAKPSLWTIVERCTREGTLQMLRDGKYDLNTAFGTKTIESGSLQQPKKKQIHQEHPRPDFGEEAGRAHDHDSDGSDGGFFEEHG